MKKIIFLTFTLLFTLNIQAQSNINIIYIDLNKLNYEEDNIRKIIDPII